MMSEMGRQTTVQVKIDSTAALGAVHRKGNGKLRHVRIGQLWVQQLEEDEDFEYRKVLGLENPADAMTKNLSATKMTDLCEKMSQQRRDGKAKSQLEL